MILTNPPFGGEEEAGIRTNFPADKQTSETALLFLQLIMRKLPLGRGLGERRPRRRGRSQWNALRRRRLRRIKHELLTEFNLHTIVRLPNGVFAPYTSIPTNLLFFNCSGPTKTIWHYEQPLPDDRKNYTKTKPIQYEEFADCLKWWGKRKENGRAWKVKASDVIRLDDAGNSASVNLDIKNPSAEEALEHLPPEQLVESILAKQKRIIEIMGEIKKVLAEAKK